MSYIGALLALAGILFAVVRDPELRRMSRSTVVVRVLLAWFITLLVVGWIASLDTLDTSTGTP